MADIGNVIPRQRAVRIGDQPVHFFFFADAHHGGVHAGKTGDVVQSLYIIGRQIAAAESLHGEYTFPSIVAGLNGSLHLLAGAGTVAVADAQAGEVDQGEDHIAFRDLSHPGSNVHVMGGHAYGADHSLCLIILKALPGSGAHVPVGILPDLVKEEDVDDIQLHFPQSLLDGVLHFFVGGAQTFGADHRKIGVFR